MLSLPIEPYLIELLQSLSKEGIEPIIAGGLGIYLKRRWVVEELEAGRREALLKAIPDARATDDIDAFLRLEALLQPQRADFRRVLSDLGYEPKKEFIQFARPTEDPKRKILLDLLAVPIVDPDIKIARGSRPPRMGQRHQKLDPPMLHAYPTPEAFAILERVRSLPLRGRAVDGSDFDGHVRVPHPFAALCMKIAAAADHERTPPADRKPRGYKHAQDVYLLVAMLSREEVDECEALRSDYRDHHALPAICQAAVEFFSTPDSPGCVAVGSRVRDADLGLFADVVTELFAPG